MTDPHRTRPALALLAVVALLGLTPGTALAIDGSNISAMTSTAVVRQFNGSISTLGAVQKNPGSIT